MNPNRCGLSSGRGDIASLLHPKVISRGGTLRLQKTCNIHHSSAAFGRALSSTLPPCLPYPDKSGRVGGADTSKEAQLSSDVRSERHAQAANPAQRLAALMCAAQAGDQAAYRTLLDDVALRLRNLVRARAPWLGHADVEDLVQDILLSLHASRATWDPARPFMPWLATIARHRMADHARRYGRRAALHLACQDLAETFGPVPANNHAETVVNFLTARDALARLSPTERDAVDMLRLRQMTLAEAAQESGSTVAALKVAVHRATKRLRGYTAGGDGSGKDGK